jgi:hypothetical protein
MFPENQTKYFEDRIVGYTILQEVVPSFVQHVLFPLCVLYGLIFFCPQMYLFHKFNKFQMSDKKVRIVIISFGIELE